jgi:hypothetical protein
MKLFIENIDGKVATKKPKTAHYVYAHGVLEDVVGYDIVCYNAATDKFDFRHDRIEPVTAVLPNGNEIPAFLYFWHAAPATESQKEAMRIDPAYRAHGRLVARNDTVAVRHCQHIYGKNI